MVITIVLKLVMNANDLKLFSALIVALFLGIPHWTRQLMAGKIRVTGGGENA